MTKKNIALALLFLGGTVCLCLGVWQWQRGQIKEQIQQRLADSNAPIALQNFSTPEEIDYRQVRVSGQYLTKIQFPIIYRMHQNRRGYEMLTPFILSGSEQVVMVNRGWIASPDLDYHLDVDFLEPDSSVVADPLNADLVDWSVAPAVQNAQTIDLQGIAMPFQKGFRLGANVLEPVSAAEVDLVPLLYLDQNDIETVLGAEVATVMLLLNQDQPGALTRIFRGLAMTSSKHIAYAVQWFLLATLQWGIALVYGWRTYRRTPSTV